MSDLISESDGEIRLSGQAYFNFINSLRTQPTKKEYRKVLLIFMKRNQIRSLEDLLSLLPKDIEQMLIRDITNMNARQLSHSYINLVICALFHFFDMNDVVLNKKKIKKFIGEYRKMHTDRAYNHEEIKKVIDTGDFRFRAIILFLASTGCRIGSVEHLLVRHLEDKGEVYKVTVYENTKEEYYTFTTPEAKKAIDEYLDYRKRCGEQVNGESSLFRNEFKMTDIQKIRKEAKAVSIATIKTILYRRLMKLGLVEISYDGKLNKKEPGRRNAVPLVHGFRKFFTTQLINAKVNPEIREMLLGHSIGLASAYYKPSEEEMLQEYMKGIDNLTIDPANRLKKEVTLLEQKQIELRTVMDRIDRIDEELKAALRDKLQAS